MSKNRSTRKPRFEQLEGRQMMAGDTAVIPNMIVNTDFEAPVDEIADVRMQAIETLFANDTADIQNGKLVADDSVVYLTEDEMIPTPENPIRIQFDAELGAHLDNRIKIGTRTDGTVGGDFKHLFEQGVDFTVEQESISIYVHETTDAGQRLGERIVPQKTIGRLDPNTTYTIIAEDYGTHAALTVKNGDTVVAYLEGNITQLSPRGAQVAIRQQTGSTELPPVLIDNLSIQHGTKEVCVPADPEARITELRSSIADLDAEISDTKAIVVTKQQQQTTLKEQLAVQVQARKDAEGAIETVIPSFSLSKPRNATSASLSFNDAEVNSEVYALNDRTKAIVLRRTLAESTGNIGLPTPPSNDRVGYQVFIVSPEGTKAYLGGWDTWYGRNYGDLTHSSMPNENRLLLQYDKPGDIDIDAIAAEIARLQGLITALKTEIADLEIEIATLQVEKATLGVALEPESHDAKIEEAEKKIALTDLQITKWGRAHKEGDEPALGEQETQLSTALGLVESSEKERSSIAQEIDNFKTEIANKEEFILKENAKEATAQHIINTWLQQEGDEAFKVTPSTRVAATRFQSFFTVYTEDMPAGYSIRFAGRDVYPITQADSIVTINGLPRPNIHIDYDVDLLDADGNLVRRLTRVKVYNGVISRVGTQNTSTSLTELAYIPEVPEDERVTEAQYTQAQSDKASAIAARTAAEADIAALEVKITQKTDEMYDVQQEQVPDNRLHVTSSGETFSLHFRSKHKQSYFEIDIQHNPGHFTRRTIEHPAGMQDGIFTFSMHNHIPAGKSGAVTITMYSDESKTELIGAFSGNYYHDHRVTGQSPGEWDGMSTQERIALYEQNIAELNAAILHHGSAYKEGDGPTLGEQKTTLELELEKAIDAKKYAEFQEHGLGRLLRIHQQLSAESLERGEHVTPETLADAAFYLAGIGEDINDLAFALDQLDEETQKQYRPMLEEATSSFLVMADAVSEEISDLLPDIQDATALLSSSTEVTTGTYSRHIDVALTTLQGLLRITSWKTQDAEGALTPADGSTSLQGLSSLDFAQVEGLVQAASFTYTIPDGVTVTARMYHGGKQVGSESLTGSGTFSYEDETGITAVILTPSTNDASYSISDVALTADANDIFEADPLGSKENGYLSNQIAPDFGRPEFILQYPMWEHIMGDNGGFWPRGGYDGPDAGTKYIVGHSNPSTQYTLFRPESGNGTASLGQPYYINDIEPYYHPVPSEFYTLVDGGIIMHPGGPEMTAITIATGSNVHIIREETADDIDGLETKLNTFDPYIEIHKIKNEWAPVEGFVAGSFSVPEGETPVLAYGQPFQIYAELVNRTGVGGTVTVQVYAGSEADPQKTLMSTHETTIGAYEKKGFIANARAQGDLETEGRPAISIVVTLPDGSQLVDGAHGRKAGRKSAAERMAAKEERKADMEAAEFASLPADVQSRVYLDYGTAQRAALMSRLSDAQRLSVLNAVNAEILGTSQHPVVREIQRSRASGGQVADIRAEHFPQLSFQQAADVVHAIEGETLNEEGLEDARDGVEAIIRMVESAPEARVLSEQTYVEAVYNPDDDSVEYTVMQDGDVVRYTVGNVVDGDFHLIDIDFDSVDDAATKLLFGQRLQAIDGSNITFVNKGATADATQQKVQEAASAILGIASATYLSEGELPFGATIEKYIQLNNASLSKEIKNALRDISRNTDNGAIDNLSDEEAGQALIHASAAVTGTGHGALLPNNDIAIEGDFEILTATRKHEAKISAHVANFAYHNNPEQIVSDLEGLGTNWEVVNAPALGITNGVLPIANATVVFVTGEINGEKTLLVGVKGTDKFSSDNAKIENLDAAADLMQDIIYIDRHLNIDLIKTIIERVSEEFRAENVIGGGHSLGGAMIQKIIDALHDNVNVDASGYTFGSPGTLEIDNNDADIINILHNKDLIPQFGAHRGLPQLFSVLANTVMVGGNYRRIGLNYSLDSGVTLTPKTLLTPHDLSTYINSIKNW